jgi:hypothetical protein
MRKTNLPNHHFRLATRGRSIQKGHKETSRIGRAMTNGLVIPEPPAGPLRISNGVCRSHRRTSQRLEQVDRGPRMPDLAAFERSGPGVE